VQVIKRCLREADSRYRVNLNREVNGTKALVAIFSVLLALLIGVAPGILYNARVPVLAPLACKLHGHAWVSADRILSDHWNSYPNGPGCYSVP